MGLHLLNFIIRIIAIQSCRVIVHNLNDVIIVITTVFIADLVIASSGFLLARGGLTVIAIAIALALTVAFFIAGGWDRCVLTAQTLARFPGPLGLGFVVIL